MTDYGTAGHLIRWANNPSLAASTPVWIVTVHAPVATDDGPAMLPRIKADLTVVLDAVNGKAIDTCTGCASLSQSQ